MFQSKAVALTILAFSQVAAMALWFSASAVVPALTTEFALSSFQQSLFTSAVQAGFVAGSVTSALFGLADRLDPRRLFMIAAFVGAAANAGLLVIDPTSPSVIGLRFVTGMCMAGVYPVGMKMAAGWARGDMGLMIGLLVGALTLGSAAPHLFNAFGGIDWRFTLIVSSLSAATAGLLINLAALGPLVVTTLRFRPGFVLWAWKIHPVRLANFGYLGHMWELYAMWAWIGAFLQASFTRSLPSEVNPTFWAKLATFTVIGAGAAGCLAGGLFADRLGRTTLTILAMGVSGTCALTVGLLFGGDPVLLTFLCIVWGVAVVADSAQFSASIAELSNRFLVGTMLTTQVAAGFTLTLLTIHLMPLTLDWLGWHYAFMPLAIGPFLGVVAMARLRASPAAYRLAGGRR